MSLFNDEDEDKEGPPSAKRHKKNYNATRKFQIIWAVKLPWAEAVLGPDGVLQMVMCTVCTDHEKKPYILGPKWDTFVKHEGKRKAERYMPKHGVKKGEYYISKDCRHGKNMHLHMARQPKTGLSKL